MNNSLELLTTDYCVHRHSKNYSYQFTMHVHANWSSAFFLDDVRRKIGRCGDCLIHSQRKVSVLKDVHSRNVFTTDLKGKKGKRRFNLVRVIKQAGPKYTHGVGSE